MNRSNPPGAPDAVSADSCSRTASGARRVLIVAYRRGRMNMVAGSLRQPERALRDVEVVEVVAVALEAHVPLIRERLGDRDQLRPGGRAREGPAVVLRARQVTLGSAPSRAWTSHAMYWTLSAVRRVSTKLPYATRAARDRRSSRNSWCGPLARSRPRSRAGGRRRRCGRALMAASPARAIWLRALNRQAPAERTALRPYLGTTQRAPSRTLPRSSSAMSRATRSHAANGRYTRFNAELDNARCRGSRRPCASRSCRRRPSGPRMPAGPAGCGRPARARPPRS